MTGDMGEMYNDWKEIKQKRGQDKLKKAEKSKRPWKKLTPWHWRIRLQGDPLDYWPTKAKWQWRGKMYVGDVEGFIKNREGE